MKFKIFILSFVLFVGFANADVFNLLQRKNLIYGPRSKKAMLNLFFKEKEVSMPISILDITKNIASYTSKENPNSEAVVYNWDFSNKLHISATYSKSKNIISTINFNVWGIDPVDLGRGIVLNKTKIDSFINIYPKAKKVIKEDDTTLYKLITKKCYALFYFNSKGVLSSISISEFDLQ